MCYWLLADSCAILFLAFLCFYEETKHTNSVSQGIAPCRTEDAIIPEGQNEIVHGKAEDKPTGTRTTPASKTGAADGDCISIPSRHYIDRSIPMDTWRRRLRFMTKTDEPLLPLFYRPLVTLFVFPAVTYTGLQYSFCLCWITVLSNVTALIMPKAPYNFNSGAIGLMGLSTFIGCIIGSIYAGFLGDWAVLRLAKRNRGRFEPEMRLHLQHAPAIIMSGGVLLFGLTIAKVGFSCKTHALLESFGLQKPTNLDCASRVCIGYILLSAAYCLVSV